MDREEERFRVKVKERLSEKGSFRDKVRERGVKRARKRDPERKREGFNSPQGFSNLTAYLGERERQ